MIQHYQDVVRELVKWLQLQELYSSQPSQSSPPDHQCLINSLQVRLTDAASMLVHRLRRWPGIKAALVYRYVRQRCQSCICDLGADKTINPCSARHVYIPFQTIFMPNIIQGQGHGRSWKTIENERIKSRPGKVLENENMAKCHGKVIEF